MHELSLIQSVIEAVQESARQEGARQVHSVTLRIGALSGVVKDSLCFCFDVASRGTLLEGARLEVEDVPAVVFCEHCNDNRTLGSIQSLRCPVCRSLATTLRQGRELEVDRIEIE